KLKYLPSWIEERRLIAARYFTLLPPSVQPVANSINDLHHLFVVRVEQRDRLAAFLANQGIETKVHFREPLHLQHGPWKNPARSLPVAERWCQSILTLPCFPGLKEDEIKYIADMITRFFEKNKNG